MIYTYGKTLLTSGDAGQVLMGYGFPNGVLQYTVPGLANAIEQAARVQKTAA